MSDNPSLETPELPDWLREAAGEKPQTGAVPQRISTFGVVAILSILALLGVIGYALYQRSLSQPTTGPAPTFTVTTFDNEPFALADLKGKVVVINFWASWCQPCRDEAPLLEQMWLEYRDRGVVFLGVNTDDIESKALAYMAEFSVTYPNAPDVGGKIEDQYRITGVPETFIVNPNGEISRHFIAPVNERDLRAEIDRALAS
jgi:cytochrome c biogenesis protein CcmG/thiol:disulfide interchange protein DsbE